MRSTKTAFCFPGVGVDHCGKELGFFTENRQTMEPFLRVASEFLGQDLASPFQNHGIHELGDREQQFFTYGYSVGVAEVCVGGGVVPEYAAGYSFGVYAALYACGSVSFETGLEILDVSGMTYNPLAGTYKLSPRDVDVNYLVATQKPDQ